MNFNKQYPTDRFYAADFKGKARTLTFRAKDPVTLELLGKGSSSEKTLPIWHFADEPKKFPAVKTNGVCARAMFGDESDAWAGRKITLYPAPDASGLSDDGLCVRVKGSPELKSKLVFTAQIGRKKKTFTLVPTGTAKAGAGVAVNAVTGEVTQPGEALPPIADRFGGTDDDIGFTDDAPHASEAAEDSEVPGRGAAAPTRSEAASDAREKRQGTLDE